MEVKEIKSHEVKVRIKDGNQFYSNEISVNVSPNEFVLDFKCISQIQDIQNHSALFIKHNPIIITPFHAKNLTELLTRAIKDYEKKFSKIEKSKAIQKAEKLIEKKEKETKAPVLQKPENYFG